MDKGVTIFISHSSEDAWVARQIGKEISARDARCFLDAASIQIGEDFVKKIMYAIGVADELVVLFTPWALKSNFIWIEIGAALQRDIPVIAVLHGIASNEFLRNPIVPINLKSHNIVRLNAFDDYLSQLKVTVQKRRSLNGG